MLDIQLMISFVIFYTSSNDQAVALTRAQSYFFLKNSNVTKNLFLYEVCIKEIRQSRWFFFSWIVHGVWFFHGNLQDSVFSTVSQTFLDTIWKPGIYQWPILKVFNNQKWFWLPKLEAAYFGQIQNVQIQPKKHQVSSLVKEAYHSLTRVSEKHLQF